MKVNRSDPTVDIYTTAIQAPIWPRIGTVTSNASITPDADLYDEYTITALAESATINAPSGTPHNGQKLIIRILDNGVAHTLTWNAIYTAIEVDIPSISVANRYVYVGCIYNSTSSKWDVVGVMTQA
jgi:hypothetical protein